MSELKDRINTDKVAAMKAKDQFTLSTLRMALAAIQTEEVAGKSARELSDAEVLTVLNREVAKRKDSAEAYTAGNRPELATKELAEVEVLQRYLPAALTDKELTRSSPPNWLRPPPTSVKHRRCGRWACSSRP